MRRRDVITLFGGAAATSALAWPFAARAQQAVPVIGFLRNTDAESSRPLVAAFRRGLAESGYVDGENVTLEYRWADNHDDRLPTLAADLVKREVAVIFAGGGSVVALAAKAATQTIPIVFELGGDPDKMGLVGSFNHPGGNLTGIALFSNVIGSKRVEFLRQVAPNAKTIGFLVQPDNPNTDGEINQTQAAASSLGVQLDVVKARTSKDIEAAFAALHQSNTGGLIIMGTPLFVATREHLVSLAAQNGIPTIYPFPSFAKAGGLMSYGDDLNDAFRQAGIYVARILKGEKAGDLPVVQPTKFELIINLKTAKALGLAVPASLIAIADEVIE
jgi:putative tryptophan/tyrosine transport system substrate-binding protein